MIIRTSLTSPFGRKARVAATHLGLPVTVQPTSANEPGSTLAQDNPLGKMPVMILDDGRRVYVVFPRGIVQGEMPPIFVLGSDGEPQIVNSRIYRNVLIVDRTASTQSSLK